MFTRETNIEILKPESQLVASCFFRSKCFFPKLGRAGDSSNLDVLEGLEEKLEGNKIISQTLSSG